MIRIDHVTFSYGEENENAGGVHDINLTVEDGQCVVLCGESGSGKTTLAKILTGLEQPDSGEVFCRGERVDRKNRKRNSLPPRDFYIHYTPFPATFQ